jgi:transcriptional regulator with XRE-family HTH domain
MTIEVLSSSFGSNVRVRRSAQGVSLRRLAARALLAPAGLHAIEHDRVSPTLRSARRIAAALEVGLDDLTRVPPALERPPREEPDK